MYIFNKNTTQRELYCVEYFDGFEGFKEQIVIFYFLLYLTINNNNRI